MISLIPMPQSLKENKGKCVLKTNPVTIKLESELLEVKDIILQTIPFETAFQQENAQLCFSFTKGMKNESYSLKINDGKIEVYTSTYEGAFYALQTLRQLFMWDIKGEKEYSCSNLEIENDSPLYSWRGLHLDVSRHYFSVETIKKYLDFMSLYKLNRFHWHLTDDQGWRIESEKYPLLTEIGSKRKESQLHSWDCTEFDNTPHEGYYTKEQVREIVKYAKARAIEIVPEIDFPAHSAAAIASYNSLACRDIPCEVLTFFGGEAVPKLKKLGNWNRTLCLGKDKVLEFVFDIIDEVCELFPFRYFHVGGDEAPTTEWKACPACQARIKAEGLKDEVALQAWFTNKLNEHLKSKGKKMVGWNEILASDIIDRDIVAQYWTPQRDKNIETHIKNSGKVILSCHKYCYFDMLYSYCTPKGTYSFDIEKAKIDEALSEGILGIEGEVWTEWTDSEAQLFFKVFNRALALSETAWTQKKNKSYSSFVKRVQDHKKLMDALDIYYGPDYLTMKPNKLKRTFLCRKHGIDSKHFDSEYKLSLTDKKR